MMRAIPRWTFMGETRSNETHESRTDADARLARKSGGHEAKLAYCGHVLIENRNGLVVDAELLRANGTAKRDAALLMAERTEGSKRVTVAADKGYDTHEIVGEMRGMKITPDVAQNDKRRGGSAIDGRTTRHARYKVSQVKRKRIDELFDWLKTVGMLPKTRPRGVHKWDGCSPLRPPLTTSSECRIWSTDQFNPPNSGEKCLQKHRKGAWGYFPPKTVEKQATEPSGGRRETNMRLSATVFQNPARPEQYQSPTTRTERRCSAVNERDRLVDPLVIVLGCDPYTLAAGSFCATARRERERTVGRRRGGRAVGRAAREPD
jgi:hypothetical protein